MLLKSRTPILYIANKVKCDFIYVLFLSLTVMAFTGVLREMLQKMRLMILIFIGTALSILLLFKLGQSYYRWWETRVAGYRTHFHPTVFNLLT